MARLQRAEQLQRYSQQTDQGRVKENGLALEPLQQAQTGSHSTRNAHPWQNNHACTQSTCAYVCVCGRARSQTKEGQFGTHSFLPRAWVSICVCVWVCVISCAYSRLPKGHSETELLLWEQKKSKNNKSGREYSSGSWMSDVCEIQETWINGGKKERERLKLEGMVREEQRIKIGDMLGRDKVMRKRGKEGGGGSNEGFSYKQTAPPSGTFCICVCVS